MFDSAAVHAAFGDYPDNFSQGDIRGPIAANHRGTIAHEVAKLDVGDPRRQLWTTLKLLSRRCRWMVPDRSGEGIPMADVLDTSDQSGALLQRLCDRFRELLTVEPCQVSVAPNGKPGRPVVTADEAAFAEALRSQSPQATWKTITDEWKRLHPDQPRTADQIEGSWRRRYRKKK